MYMHPPTPRQSIPARPIPALPASALPTAGMAAFRDRVVIRDPRAGSRDPALRPIAGGLEVRGAFTIRRRIPVDRARGVRFVVATGDANPIHREGEVVPGAFIAAQVVSSLELLLPRLRPGSLRVSFQEVSWYGRPLRMVLRCTPMPVVGQPGLRAEVSVHQDRREVATAVVEGQFVERVERVELPPHKVDRVWLERVSEFYGALGIDPAAWLQKEEGADLSYPVAFLASLPSGTMVDRLSGQGGILNRLTFEFGARKLPLAGPPEVSLELPARLRQSFNKILTLVREGVETAVRGSALVLQRAPEELLQRPVR